MTAGRSITATAFALTLCLLTACSGATTATGSTTTQAMIEQTDPTPTPSLTDSTDPGGATSETESEMTDTTLTAFTVTEGVRFSGFTTGPSPSGATGGTQSAKLHYLFLHGAAFQAQTWVDNGILLAVTSEGADATSIDLPGRGQTPQPSIPDDEFVAAVLRELSLDPSRTIIIAPSMSGGFLLPGLRNGSLDGLAGVVPVAPVGAAQFVSEGPPVDVAALIVWGDRDGSDPQASADALAAGFSNAQTLIIDNAGHAAYMDQPEAFTAALTAFGAKAGS